eukprot:TRINITY_DN17262_c0_g1_i1.p1 TRINITY_DN17262_c0_g1~~TRINITY_DN17262_c0_g1_i1.p1  ORF type:complete len:1600 (+),score=111.69 TRINITY_DN17262_c0_g1_i1:414-4802(+)
MAPTRQPTHRPSVSPSMPPAQSPTEHPTSEPTAAPTTAPSGSPTPTPRQGPTLAPTLTPSAAPATAPSASPRRAPSRGPTQAPLTMQPSAMPTERPIIAPTTLPTTDAPTASWVVPPTAPPSSPPSPPPSANPTQSPSNAPSGNPTWSPHVVLTMLPTVAPTTSFAFRPTAPPIDPPTPLPSANPTQSPSNAPSPNPTWRPYLVPTILPTPPTKAPTSPPLGTAGRSPTQAPGSWPTWSPWTTPPTVLPRRPPTRVPSLGPSFPPGGVPTGHPATPTAAPLSRHTPVWTLPPVPPPPALTFAPALPIALPTGSPVRAAPALTFSPVVPPAQSPTGSPLAPARPTSTSAPLPPPATAAPSDPTPPSLTLAPVPRSFPATSPTIAPQHRSILPPSPTSAPAPPAPQPGAPTSSPLARLRARCRTLRPAHARACAEAGCGWDRAGAACSDCGGGADYAACVAKGCGWSTAAGLCRPCSTFGADEGSCTAAGCIYARSSCHVGSGTSVPMGYPSQMPSLSPSAPPTPSTPAPPLPRWTVKASPVTPGTAGFSVKLRVCHALQELEDPLDMLTSPTGLRIGNGTAAAYQGALIEFLCFVTIVQSVSFLLFLYLSYAGAARMRRRHGADAPRVSKKLRLVFARVGSAVYPLTFYFPVGVFVAATLVFHADAPLFRILSVVVLVGSFCFIGFVAFITNRATTFAAVLPCEPDGCLEFFFDSDSSWETIGSELKHLLYRIFYDALKLRDRTLFAIDLSVNCLIGLGQSYRPQSDQGCDVKEYSVLCLMVLYALYITIRRPYLSLYEQGSTMTVLWAEIAAKSLQLKGAGYDEDHWANGAAITMENVTIFMLQVIAIIGLCVFLRDEYDIWRELPGGGMRYSGRPMRFIRFGLFWFVCNRIVDAMLSFDEARQGAERKVVVEAQGGQGLVRGRGMDNLRLTGIPLSQLADIVPEESCQSSESSAREIPSPLVFQDALGARVAGLVQDKQVDQRRAELPQGLERPRGSGSWGGPAPDGGDNLNTPILGGRPGSELPSEGSLSREEAGHALVSPINGPATPQIEHGSGWGGRGAAGGRGASPRRLTMPSQQRRIRSTVRVAEAILSATSREGAQAQGPPRRAVSGLSASARVGAGGARPTSLSFPPSVASPLRCLPVASPLGRSATAALPRDEEAGDRSLVEHLLGNRELLAGRLRSPTVTSPVGTPGGGRGVPPLGQSAAGGGRVVPPLGRAATAPLDKEADDRSFVRHLLDNRELLAGRLRSPTVASPVRTPGGGPAAFPLGRSESAVLAPGMEADVRSPAKHPPGTRELAGRLRSPTVTSPVRAPGRAVLARTLGRSESAEGADAGSFAKQLLDNRALLAGRLRSTTLTSPLHTPGGGTARPQRRPRGTLLRTPSSEGSAAAEGGGGYFSTPVSAADGQTLLSTGRPATVGIRAAGSAAGVTDGAGKRSIPARTTRGTRPSPLTRDGSMH